MSKTHHTEMISHTNETQEHNFFPNIVMVYKKPLNCALIYHLKIRLPVNVEDTSHPNDLSHK